jgi:hypothetical protein
MRRRRHLFVALFLLGLPTFAAAAPDCKATDMTQPLALTIQEEPPAADGSRLMNVELHNCSNRTVSVLFDTQLQPPMPMLKRADGRAVAFSDRRRVAKFDRTVHAADFTPLAPGQMFSQPLAVEVEEGRYTVQLGPFASAELAPGRYALSVEWNSRQASAIDDDSGKKVPVRDGWTGALRSATVPLVLAPRHP